jgi:hypothetical protein
MTARPSSLALRPRHLLLVASLIAAPALTSAPAFAQPGAAAPSDAAATKKALDLFKKGQGLYKSNKFAEALPLFRESYGLVASPNSRIYIARCLASTGDVVAGYEEFEALIADVDARNDPKYADARTAAVAERDELAQNKLALVTITVQNPSPSTKVSIGGRDIPVEKWGKPVPVAPGPTEVTITTLPGNPQTRNVDLAAGEKKPIALDAAPPTTAPPPVASSGGSSRSMLRPAAYVAGGVGVVGMGLFAVFGGLANSTYSDLTNKCQGSDGARSCPSDARGQIDDGKMQKDVANAGLIIGAAGLAAGVTLFVLSMDRGPKKEAQVQPVAGPGYVGVQGVF